MSVITLILLTVLVHANEDRDEAFDELFSVFERETWWDFDDLLELYFGDLRVSFAFGVVCGHLLDLGLFSERTLTWCSLVRPQV